MPVVILSEAKNLTHFKQMLRFAQHDSVASHVSLISLYATGAYKVAPIHAHAFDASNADELYA